MFLPRLFFFRWSLIVRSVSKSLKQLQSEAWIPSIASSYPWKIPSKYPTAGQVDTVCTTSAACICYLHMFILGLLERKKKKCTETRFSFKSLFFVLDTPTWYGWSIDQVWPSPTIKNTRPRARRPVWGQGSLPIYLNRQEICLRVVQSCPCFSESWTDGPFSMWMTQIYHGFRY